MVSERRLKSNFRMMRINEALDRRGDIQMDFYKEM